MKILIISGFLGAGKTTFIRELVQRTGREMVILENEYATAGVDGGLLEDSLSSDKKVNIWELTEGCICCSMKGDFAASVLTIANTLDPDYLIVEPTGVGKLSGVISSLQRIEYERIALLAPATIVDGRSLWRYRSEYPEIFEDQIVSAHTLVLSKMEHADGREIKSVESALRGLNPRAEILTSHYSGMESGWWKALLERDYHGKRISRRPEAAEKLPDSYTLENVFMETPEELLLFLEELVRGKLGNVFRAKGVLPAGSQTLRFDVADGRYTVDFVEATEKKTGEAVFIGEAISRRQIGRHFKRLPDTDRKPRRIAYRGRR